MTASQSVGRDKIHQLQDFLVTSNDLKFCPHQNKEAPSKTGFASMSFEMKQLLVDRSSSILFCEYFHLFMKISFSLVLQFCVRL